MRLSSLCGLHGDDTEHLDNVSFAPTAGEQKNLGNVYYQKGFTSRCQLKQIMSPFFYVIKLNDLLNINRMVTE